MANELKHGTQGTELAQTEFEAVGLHVFNSQATGDLPYASSATQISRLGIGAADRLLASVSGIPAWRSLIDVMRSLYKANLPPMVYDLGANATETVVGSGVSLLTSGYMRLRTGTTANSSILRTSLAFGYRNASPDSIDFSKQFGIFFIIARETGDTEAEAYVHFKAATTLANLVAAGVGVKMANLTLTGQSYGSALGDVALGTMSDFQGYPILIWHDPGTPTVDFYVRGSKTSNAVAAQQPTGNVAANLTIGIKNGATGTINAALYCTPIYLMQEP